uniref:Uncharacterized protein n=1 Tax=Rhizobium rhizogenes TaxID=359 RepID=A0A7S4ZS52_RHIRH|nr:hypothetical protein pC5.7c_574 [Rhizobium rhizogenes]
MSRHSLVQSSTTVRTRKLRPSDQCWCSCAYRCAATKIDKCGHSSIASIS